MTDEYGELINPRSDYNLREKDEDERNVFDVVTKEEIDDCKETIIDKFGIDLSDISINIIHPGEDDYDHYEIQQNLFLKCNSDFNTMIDLIESYGYDSTNLTTEQFKNIAEKEDIIVEGKFPSFAMMYGEEEIIFFGIKEKNAVEMAKKFAKKEGEKEETIADIEDAKKYLKSLGKKYFLHEAGHAVYYKLGEHLQNEWKNFIEKYPEIKAKTIEVQKDRYSDDTQIPVVKEVFADYFIDVTSDKEGFSRMGENNEITDKIRELLLEFRNEI